MEKFDFIVIGGGAGAFAAAIRANDLKAKTAMVNAGLPLGGTCVNVGCVPSKTLLYAGEVLHHAKHHGIPGIDIEVKGFDFKKVVQDELALVERMRKEKYEDVLGHLEHVTLIEGRAEFVGAGAIEVNGKQLTAEKFLIAAGSTATAPSIEGLRETGYITHIEALKPEQQPKELIIIGAGPLGLEFSQMYARFGTKVTILQRAERIFPYSEPALTNRLAELLEKEGISVRVNADVRGVHTKDGQKIVSYAVEGQEKDIAAEEILVATGKRPNTDDLRLKVAGIDTDKRGAIVVNEQYQTSNEAVYAAGDVVALPLRLETTAGREGTLAAGNALTGEKAAIDYDSVPYTVFTDPQLAGVGLTEATQMESMGRCACRTVSLEMVPKAAILRQTEGFISMAIHPDTQEILGVHMLGPSASEVVAEAMMLIKNKNTIDDVINSVPMFPTMAEAIKIVALSFTRDISKLSCCV